MPKESNTGESVATEIAGGEGVSCQYPSDTGSTLGEWAMSAKPVLTGDFTESQTYGHESMSCSDDVGKTDAVFVLQQVGKVLSCWNEKLAEYFGSGEGGCHYIKQGEYLALEGMTSIPVSVGNQNRGKIISPNQSIGLNQYAGNPLGAMADWKSGTTKGYLDMEAMDSFGTHLTLFHLSEETAICQPTTGEKIIGTTNTADVINTE